MNRRGIIFTILMLLLVLPTLTAQVFTDIDWKVYERDSILPRYRCSVPLDEDFACFKYSADIEYPEFVPMSDSHPIEYQATYSGGLSFDVSKNKVEVVNTIPTQN